MVGVIQFIWEEACIESSRPNILYDRIISAGSIFGPCLRDQALPDQPHSAELLCLTQCLQITQVARSLVTDAKDLDMQTPKIRRGRVM